MLLRRNRRTSGAWLAAIAAACAAALVAPAAGPSARGDDAASVAGPARQMDQRLGHDVRPFLEAHCYQCHGNGKHKGDITLDQFKDFASVLKDRKTWQSVQDVLEQHEMPPKKQKQPPPEELTRFTQFVSDVLNFGSGGPHDPGFVAIHRLNRNEYDNTIRDLVGVDFNPAADFPADDTGYGFDNIADVLSMSPLLAEKYLSAAEQVMDKAVVLESPFKRKTVKYAAQLMKGGEPTDDDHRILASEGEITQGHAFPVTAEYEFRIAAEADQAGDEPAKMEVSIGQERIRTFDVKNRRGHSRTFTFRRKIAQGSHRVRLAFVNDFYDPDNPDPAKRDRNLIIDSLEVDGPMDAPPPEPSDVQKRLLYCGPADGQAGEACAANIARSFATRAFRRPPTDEEVSRLVGIYRECRSEADPFEQACKVMLEAVLVSPQFLYRIELDDPAAHPGQPHALNDYELATRLSYFLWSSMPDDELFKLADEHALARPANLDGQLKRMLADPRADAFVTNFAGQWLELRNLNQANPDPKKFPEFPGLKDDMRREGELFFENLIREDRSVLDLLDANYTFVNERLAKFYGIENVSGDEFRRVELKGDTARERGGVLTMAGVMTVTALPNRTSPVKRGKFILDMVLGTPPPPPPPDVPQLGEKQTDIDGSTVRQRVEAHRQNPACASCHARMDPLGFALENFDAIGRWREKDGRFPIDAADKLPTGETLDGPAGLKNMLLSHKDLFVKCLVQKLMTYALGRGLDYYDSATVKQICEQAGENDYRFSSIISGIAQSDAFLKRRAKIAG